jgi:hypothetical protein
MCLDDIAERRTGVGQQQARTAAAATLPDPIGLENKRLQTGDRTCVRRRAPSQSTADDDDASAVLAAEPRKIRPTRFGKELDPGRNAVTCAHE